MAASGGSYSHVGNMFRGRQLVRVLGEFEMLRGNATPYRQFVIHEQGVLTVTPENGITENSDARASFRVQLDSKP